MKITKNDIKLTIATIILGILLALSLHVLLVEDTSEEFHIFPAESTLN